MTLQELRELASKAPTVVFDDITESGRFYEAANPQTILTLLDRIEKAKETLEKFTLPRGVTCSEKEYLYDQIASEALAELEKPL